MFHVGVGYHPKVAYRDQVRFRTSPLDSSSLALEKFDVGARSAVIANHLLLALRCHDPRAAGLEEH